MKIRNGFVSNSSSSSFVIAAKEGKTVAKMVIEIDLAKYARYTIKNEKDLLAYYKEEFGKYNDEISQERDAVLRKALRENKVVYIGEFSSESDDPLEQFLCENGLQANDKSLMKDITVIESEGGY